MTEKEVRKRLATASPAEIPLVCMYLVASVFEPPPLPSPKLVLGWLGMDAISNRTDVVDGVTIATTSHMMPTRCKPRKKKPCLSG